MGCRVAFLQDENGVNGPYEQVAVLIADLCQGIDMVRADHDGERLFDPSQAVLEDVGRLDPA